MRIEAFKTFKPVTTVTTDKELVVTVKNDAAQVVDNPPVTGVTTVTSKVSIGIEGTHKKEEQTPTTDDVSIFSRDPSEGMYFLPVTPVTVVTLTESTRVDTADSNTSTGNSEATTGNSVAATGNSGARALVGPLLGEPGWEDGDMAAVVGAVVAADVYEVLRASLPEGWAYRATETLTGWHVHGLKVSA